MPEIISRYVKIARNNKEPIVDKEFEKKEKS